jgi:hypothetical protein
MRSRWIVLSEREVKWRAGNRRSYQHLWRLARWMRVIILNQNAEYSANSTG